MEDEITYEHPLGPDFPLREEILHDMRDYDVDLPKTTAKDFKKMFLSVEEGSVDLEDVQVAEDYSLNPYKVKELRSLSLNHLMKHIDNLWESREEIPKRVLLSRLADLSIIFKRSTEAGKFPNRLRANHMQKWLQFCAKVGNFFDEWREISWERPEILLAQRMVIDINECMELWRNLTEYLIMYLVTHKDDLEVSDERCAVFELYNSVIENIVDNAEYITVLYRREEYESKENKNIDNEKLKEYLSAYHDRLFERTKQVTRAHISGKIHYCGFYRKLWKKIYNMTEETETRTGETCVGCRKQLGAKTSFAITDACYCCICFDCAGKDIAQCPGCSKPITAWISSDDLAEQRSLIKQDGQNPRHFSAAKIKKKLARVKAQVQSQRKPDEPVDKEGRGVKSPSKQESKGSKKKKSGN